MSYDTKYRPVRFADVLGQVPTINVLRRFLATGTGRQQSYLFAGPFGEGKCVTGETLVTTDRGLLPIQDLMGESQISPLSINVFQEGGIEAPTAYSYRGGERETVRITTHRGYSIEGTPNHRIRVMSPEGDIVWCGLQDIKKGDFACIVRGGIFGTGADLSGFKYSHSTRPGTFRVMDWVPPKTLTPEWGRLLGYLVGDGSCKEKTGLSIACAEKDVKVDQIQLLRSLTGAGSETSDKRSKTGLSNLRSSREQVRDFLAYAGLAYAGAADKEVPWAVMASPEPVVREFLRGYFEADGSVGSHCIELTTKSEKLARQVQVLLLKFGVVPRRALKKNPKYGHYWRLTILASDWDAFTQVGFVSTRKSKAFRSLVCPERYRGKLTNVREVTPHQKNWVKRFYLQLPEASRTRGNWSLFQCQSPRSRAQCTSRQVNYIADNYRESDPSGHFTYIQKINYCYDSVTQVEAGKAEVFDLNVPDGEMFSANGFMNHNTTLGRILARGLLCDALTPEGDPCDQCDSCRSMIENGTSLDFIEVDAATNSGKDDIKKVTEDIQYATFSGKRRIYLFDECFTEDTLLVTREGKVSIRDLVELRYTGDVLSYNPDTQKPVWVAVTDWFSLGERDVVTVTFDNGVELTVTPNQEFLTHNRGWVSVTELTSEDDVVDEFQFPSMAYKGL